MNKFVYIPRSTEPDYGKPHIIYVIKDIPDTDGSGWWGGSSSEDEALKLKAIGSPGAFYSKNHCVPYSDFAWQEVQKVAGKLLDAKEEYKALAYKLSRPKRKTEANDSQLVLANESNDTKTKFQLGLFGST